jgi:hypothetical protein
LAAGLLLTVLAALAGGAVLAGVAGAYRTGSAFGRLQAAAREADFVVSAEGDPATFDPTPVANAPGVARSGVVDGFAMFEIRPDDTFDLQHSPTLLTPEEDVAFAELDRPIIVQGRAPEPGADDEVVVPELTRDLGHPVGSTITACLFEYRDLSALGGAVEGRDPTLGEQRKFAKKYCTVRQLRVVGVSRLGPDEVVLHPTSDREQFIIGSPALDAAVGQRRVFSFVQVELQPGADVNTFVNAVLDRVSPGAQATIQSNSLRAAVVARTVEPYVRALSLFAVAVAIAAVGVLGPSLVRWTAIPDSYRGPLLAMGLRPRQLRVVSMLRGAAVGVGAAAGAAAMAIAVSARFPIGLARRIDPDLGVHVDRYVLLVGCVVIVVVCTALGGMSRRTAPRGASQPSRVANRLQSSGATPAMVVGVRAALGRGGGAGSAAVGVAMAIVAVTSALTFQAGLGRLLDTPARYGWTWDAVVDSRDNAMVPGELVALRTSRVAQSVTLGRRTTLLADGAAIPTFTFTSLRGDNYPSVDAGRAPRGDAEIALGQQTLDRLGRQVGDHLLVRGANGVRVDTTIVGRTLLPLINLNQDLSVAEGGIVDLPLLKRVGGAQISLALIDLMPGSSVADLRAAMGAIEGPPAKSGTVLGPTYTADLRGYDAVRGTPLLLAGLLALLGLGVLAHTIVAAARRRRRELALLRCLGFLRRDVRSSVRWNAITIVVVCLLVSLPIGVALGRGLWSSFARGIGVASDATTPGIAIVVVVTATVASAIALAAVPGRRAGQLRPGEVLRNE